MHRSKRIISSLLAGSVLVTSGAVGGVTATADELLEMSEPGELCYEMLDDGTYAVTTTGTFRGAVEIPAEVDGIAVTEIRARAFYDQDHMTSVTVPDSVVTIGDEAFCECLRLEEIVLGSGVETIGDFVFGYCHNITEINIPARVTSIGEGAFCDCNALTAIFVDDDNTAYCDDDGVLYTKDIATLLEYPCGKTDSSYTALDGVTLIDTDSFAFSEHLVDVTLPDSVTEIGENAFYECTALETISLGAGLETIGKYAFNLCESLTIVSLPATLTSIGEGAFNDCHSVMAYEVDPASSVYASEDGVLFDKEMETLMDYPCGRTVEEYDVPDGVTMIGDYAFGFCQALKKVTLPDSVTEIGKNAFYFCGNLTTISLGNGVTRIDDYAFEICESLQHITLPESVTYVDMDAFFGCESLASITFLNATCEVDAPIDTFGFTGTVYGYTDSTAQAYAEKYNHRFVALDAELPTGDIDGDGEISPSDAYEVLTAYAMTQLGQTVELVDVQVTAADIDGDGEITPTDAYYILTYYAEMQLTGAADWTTILS